MKHAAVPNIIARGDIALGRLKIGLFNKALEYRSAL
jgi:hypothetical protein